VARHAAAGHAWVRVDEADGVVELEVGDDGAGFDANRQIGPAHHGLANMRKRATGIGAGLEVVSDPGSGTRIIVRIPRRAMQRGGRQ
jgi:signal transduction histidine kinase